jgi:hypothetical protein
MTIKPEPPRETPAVTKPNGTEEPKPGTDSGSSTQASGENVTSQDTPRPGQDTPPASQEAPRTPDGPLSGTTRPDSTGDTAGHAPETQPGTAAVDHSGETSASVSHENGLTVDHESSPSADQGNTGQAAPVAANSSATVTPTRAGADVAAVGLSAASAASVARSASSIPVRPESAPRDSLSSTSTVRPGPDLDDVSPQVSPQVQTVIQAARDRAAPLFGDDVPQEYFGFLAAHAHPQAPDTAPGAQGDAGTRTDPAEAAWQEWLSWARERFPGPAPLRPDMTMSEAADWINSHSHDMAAEAAGSYIERFDATGGQQYVNFHWEQAQAHARNMVLSDLGVDVQRWQAGDVQPHQPPHPGDDSTRGDVGQSDFAQIDNAQLPTRTNGTMLPTFERGVAVGGVFAPSQGGLLIEGQVRSPAETAQWIRRWTPWSDQEPVPVVLIGGGGAADGAVHGDGAPAFAAALAEELGVPVIASPGSVLHTPDGNFHAGTAVTGHGGQPALVSLGGDSWVIHEPDGSAHPVAPDLNTVTIWLGLGMEPPERNPAVPTVWSRHAPAPPRDGLGTNVYPEIPLDTWLTAASMVQRWDHYPMVIDTGIGPAVERYQRYQDIAAVAQVIIDGAREPHPAERTGRRQRRRRRGDDGGPAAGTGGRRRAAELVLPTAAQRSGGGAADPARHRADRADAAGAG